MAVFDKNLDQAVSLSTTFLCWLRRVIALAFIAELLLFQYWFASHIFSSDRVNGFEVDAMVFVGLMLLLTGPVYFLAQF